MNHTDDHLINLLNQGDPGAFAAVYEAQYPKVYYFVRQFIRERQDAEDITAEIFVKLWKMRTGITSIKNLEAFLYITSRNTCIDFLRYQKRRQSQQQYINYLRQEAQHADGLPEDIFAEVLQELYREIEKLPGSCRKVFTMSYLEGRSTEEIASALQINPQSVYNHKQRAIKLLRLAMLYRKIGLPLLILSGILTEKGYF